MAGEKTSLYDRGHLGDDPKHRLLVSPRLREEFGNGEQFYTRVGRTIAVPEHRTDRPNREFLEWHLDTIFEASRTPREHPPGLALSRPVRLGRG